MICSINSIDTPVNSNQRLTSVKMNRVPINLQNLRPLTTAVGGPSSFFFFMPGVVIMTVKSKLRRQQSRRPEGHQGEKVDPSDGARLMQVAVTLTEEVEDAWR